MRKFVVLSVNNNPQYQFYLPLTCWAWQKIGWTPIIFYTEQTSSFVLACKHIPEVQSINFHRLVVDGYKSETVAQISRLYAACLYGPQDDYFMTSDADMVPLSDYWKFNPSNITIFGWDLTEFQHIPICYVCMSRTRWVEVMGLTNHNYNVMIKRDLDAMPTAKSLNFEEWWSVDQQLLTQRINAVNFPKEIVPRGAGSNGYPWGRVDRSAWSIEHPQLIDCHMMRDIYRSPENLAKTMLLLYKAFPGEDFAWFGDYTIEFAKNN